VLRTLMNRRAKLDAASFILGREIRNCTNTQNYKQMVTDLSTPRLSACVDNNTVLAVLDMLLTTGHFCMCVFCKKAYHFPV